MSTSYKSAFGAVHVGFLHAIEAEARTPFQGLCPPTQEAFETFMRAREEGFWRACILLREVVNNPFRTVSVDPSWLTWQDATIPKIAKTIYDERRFTDLPNLADALEDAGCTDADILNHCRGEGPHVRGCWVVDLLLGKQ